VNSKLTALGLLLVLLGPVACGGSERQADNPLRYSENAKREYEEALDAYFDRDWEEAILLMEEVRRKYGYSRYSRLAQLRIADATFRQQKLPEAVTAYKGFVHDYPNDPEVSYARYRMAEALYEQCRPALLLPPLEERDLATVHDAHQVLSELLSDYPEHKRLPEMRHMVEVVTGILARHEIYVSRFYLQRDNFKAAAARASYAIETYPGSGLTPEAMVLLAEVYFKMGQDHRARSLLKHVLGTYPDSPFVVPARRFLKELASAEAE